MFWNRVLSWDGSRARYQSNKDGRWYTIEQDDLGVWVLRVSVAHGCPGAVEFRHKCSTLNRAKEIAEQISKQEVARGNVVAIRFGK